MKSKRMIKLMLLSLVFSLLVGCGQAYSPKSNESTRAPSAPAAKGSQGDMATSGAFSPNSGNAAAPMDRLIIYTANMTVIVKDLNQAVDAATDIVNVAGGIVAGTKMDSDPSQKNNDSGRTAYMSLRVPATKYQDVMAKLRKLSIKPPDEDSSSQDVTEEYTDLQAQLRNLEVVEAQYQELVKKAVTIDEILKVQQKLGETRGQIERIKGRIVYLERRADMATVNLYLRPEIPGKDTKPGAWDPIKEASEAWDASLAFLQILASVTIKVAVFFWWTLPLLVMAIALFQVWRGRRRPAMTPGA